MKNLIIQNQSYGNRGSFETSGDELELKVEISDKEDALRIMQNEAENSKPK